MKRLIGNFVAFVLLSGFFGLFVAGLFLDAHEVDQAIIEWKKDWLP